uniref:Uncharacterized protein n=1 Tax=viral metagenome TaxID=1070528 RepID=A0A6M3LMT6_9ZZZZ
MKNIETRIDGNILTVTIDLSKRFGLSNTGKSTIIASTEGNQPVIPGVAMGINVYTKETRR